MASKSPCARQRINLTMEDKLKVIEHHEQHGTSTRKLAVIFGCGRTQVQQILMKREEIRRFCETSQESILKKRRQAYKTKYDIISQAVYIWFLKMRLKNLPLNGPILQEKAKQVAHEIAERSNDNEQSAALRAFTASNGWLHNFKERYGLSTISFAGEPKQWSSTASGCLKEMLEDYDTNNIFNLNEAGKFKVNKWPVTGTALPPFIAFGIFFELTTQLRFDIRIRNNRRYHVFMSVYMFCRHSMV